jgi:hypothetical protein
VLVSGTSPRLHSYLRQPSPHCENSAPPTPPFNKALNQTNTVSEDDSDITKEVFTESDLYHNCDTPLNVVTDLLHSGDTPTVVTNFKVMEEGGITRVGDTELPDEKKAHPEACDGLQKKTATCRYLGPVWEEH